jgi:hypothetical protein
MEAKKSILITSGGISEKIDNVRNFTVSRFGAYHEHPDNLRRNK